MGKVKLSIIVDVEDKYENEEDNKYYYEEIYSLDGLLNKAKEYSLTERYISDNLDVEYLYEVAKENIERDKNGNIVFHKGW